LVSLPLEYSPAKKKYIIHFLTYNIMRKKDREGRRYHCYELKRKLKRRRGKRKKDTDIFMQGALI
jgi:hypothetical protein